MIGFAYNFGWLVFALGTLWLDEREHDGRQGGDGLAGARSASWTRCPGHDGESVQPLRRNT